MKRFLFKIRRTGHLLVTAFLLYAACAKEGFPPGGPEDKTPPEITKTVPAQESTRVPTGIQVEIHFSERVKAPSSKEAVFITPYPGKDVKFKWRSKRLDIKFPAPLKPDRTYVITIGTVIRDERSNPLESSYSLAFSTGDSLDRCEIFGRVYGESKATGIGVWAYTISDTSDINPSLQEPDYAVQCGEDGSYHFTHLAFGRYRLFSVQDRLGDRLYKPMEDRIGIGCRELVLNSSDQSAHLDFFMTREDTLNFGLSMAAAQYNRKVTLHFNKSIGALTDSFRVVIETDSRQLQIQSFCIDPELPRRMQLQLASPLSESSEYLIRLGGIVDKRGNPLQDSLSMARFAGTAEEDTTSPELLLSQPKHQQRNVPLEPEFHLLFNEMMDSTGLGGIQVRDSAGIPAEVDFRFINPREMVGKAALPLQPFHPYEWTLDSAQIRDLAGNFLADTLIRFVTLNPDTLTEILGTIADENPSATGPIIITAEQRGLRADTVIVQIAGPGAYQISNLMPGEYVVSCFRDEDENGKYTHGRPYSYQPSERFVFYPDTIRVRSRWPNDGNDFQIPR